MTTWDELENNLARELPFLNELDTWFWEANGRCVQLQQTRLELCMSIISNEYLPPEHALSSAEEAYLGELGWHQPEPGLENWHAELTWPITSTQAQQAARMLRKSIELVLLVKSLDEVEHLRTTAHIADPRRRRAAQES